jgi:putative flippase GtrA
VLKVKGRLRQPFMYLIGGCLCAAIDVAVLQLLIAAGASYVVATSAGFFVGLAINYAFHARLTFRTISTAYNFFRYLCVVGINYLITLAFVGGSVSAFGFPLLGKLASLPIIAVNGFLLGKYWIFRPANRRSDQSI